MNKISVLVLAALFAMPSFAQDMNFEVGYTTVSADDGGVSIDLGGLYATVGYEWGTSGDYTNEVEGVVILGITNDTFGPVSIDLEPTIEVAYRGTFETSIPELKFFWRAAYTRIELDLGGGFGGGSESADESDFGLGIGGQWRGITLGYNQYFGDLEDFSRITLGHRF